MTGLQMTGQVIIHCSLLNLAMEQPNKYALRMLTFLACSVKLMIGKVYKVSDNKITVRLTYGLASHL